MPDILAKTKEPKAVPDSGIYSVSHNGKVVYVGASTNLPKRLEHQRCLIYRRRFPWRKLSYVAMSEFKFKIVELVHIVRQKSKRLYRYEDVCERERFWIRKLRPVLNVTHNPDNSPAPGFRVYRKRKSRALSAL